MAAAASRPRVFPGLMARLQSRFTKDWVELWTGAPEDPGPDPVFLIGFPRSGTTLLDQVLDAHPGVTTLEERDTVDVLRRKVDTLPGGYPEALATLEPAAINALRDDYRDRVAYHLADRRKVC